MRSALLTWVILFMLALTGVAASGAEFRAGAGKSEIQTSPGMLPLEGYSSVHDQASVRVLLMDDSRSRFAIVVVETPSISEATISGVKATLTKLAGVSSQNAIIMATHSTSAPHVSTGGPSPSGSSAPGAPGGPSGPGAPAGPGGAGGPGAQNNAGAAAYAKALDAAVEIAVKQATSSLQPAKVGFGIGTTSINVNRYVLTPRGWSQGSNSAGFSDRSLPVVRIEGVDGKPVALLINAPVRPVVMDGSKDKDGGKSLSADLSGATARYVEQWYGGGTVALFLMGAAVDQVPFLQSNRSVLNPDGSITQVDLKEAGFTLLDLLGERLGSEAIQTGEGIKATAQPTIEVWRRTLKVPTQVRSTGGPSSGPVQSYTYQPGQDVEIPVVLMRIGDIAIAGIQPELASSVGVQIKTQSPYPNTIVVTMADGGAKYMPDAQSYDRFTPEARGSSFARGAAELTASGIDNLLTQMKQSSAGK